MKKTDYLIIGAGIGGLCTAYLLSKFGNVLVVTKGKLKQSNTYWAQGGIAAVMSKEDSFEAHIKDTFQSGAQQGDRRAIRYLAESAPRAIRFLESIGVKFLDEPGLEAGHSCPRVWRTSDFTGQNLLDQLVKVVKKVKNITILEETDALELIVYNHLCYGCFARHNESQKPEPILAKNTILATGGLGQLFARTTNTLGSSGDGLALAIKAGLELKDMEFIQFHPTALAQPDNGRYFLLSETLRGAGAKLVNSNGKSFVEKFDRRGEMAPRDILTRIVYFQQMNGSVYLDMRHLDAAYIKKRFPNIYKRLKNYKLDLTKDLIPITPVAHYACGGIQVDLKGATALPGLFAIGETACTGVHGANRLASNSLLEAVVFSLAVAETLEKGTFLDQAEKISENIPLTPPKIAIEVLPQVQAYAKRIGEIMWEYVGIVRTTGGLKKAMKRIESIPARDYRIQHRQIVCYKIIEACLNSPVSIGAHYITDELV